MKIRQNCRNPECLAKNSMISIVTKTNYSTKKIIKANYSGEDEKIYRTHKTLTAFYICKKCTWMSDFKLKDICERGLFRIALVSKSYVTKNKKLKSKKNSRCIFYNQSNHPIKQPDDKVIRLFIGSTNEYLGYYCNVCRIAYAVPLRIIKWNSKLSKSSSGTETVNILNPPKYDEEDNVLVNNIVLKTTQYHPTTSGPPESPNNFQSVRVLVPQNKMNKFKKWLEKQDCEIT